MASATTGFRDGSQTSRQRNSSRAASGTGSLALPAPPPLQTAASPVSARRHAQPLAPGASSSLTPPRLHSLSMPASSATGMPPSRVHQPPHAPSHPPSHPPPPPPPPPPPLRPSPVFASTLPRIPPQPPAAAHTLVPTDYHTRRIRRRVVELEQRIALLMLEKEQFAMQEKYARARVCPIHGTQIDTHEKQICAHS